MRKFALLAFFCISSTLFAGGFDMGVQVGVFSPNKGLEDNDNGIALGGHLKFKFATIALKLEGFYIDSSGRYQEELGDEFGVADLDVKSVIAADVMLYPLATTFFLEAGLNHINLDDSGFTQEMIDNELGLEIGGGITLFDKLLLQGKILYTPNALKDDVADTIDGLDKNILGYMITIGWSF